MSTDVSVRFGIRLRELRKAKGWTQFELSERVGLDRSYLAEVETGKIEICLRNLDLLAQTFEMELHQLVHLSATKGR